MDIRQIRHSWPEPAGFTLNRPRGTGDHVLLHFQTAVELRFSGRTYQAQPGALLILGPQTGHRLYSPGPLLHDWMHLGGDVAGEIAPCGLQTDTLYQMGCSQQITQLTAQLEAEFFAKRTLWPQQVQALLAQLWVLLARDLAGESPAPLSREMADRLRSLRARMLLHPENEWSNARMAAQVGISLSRLYPLYQRMFSISPGRDLILMRVEKARNLLLQGETVSRTAESLGYASTYHFIRQFKQITGLTPGQVAGGQK